MNLQAAQMSLNEVWDTAAPNPFYPFIAKDSQFFYGFSLLLAGELNPFGLRTLICGPATKLLL